LKSLLFLLFLIAPHPPGKMIDAVAAVVEGEVITLGEVKQELQLGAETPKEALERLIEERVLELEARRTGMEVKAEEVEEAIEEVLMRNRLTRQELKELLRREGTDMERYRREIYFQMLKGRVISRWIRPQVVVTEEDLRGYYRSHRDLFRPDEQVHIRQIFISWKGGRARALRQARKALSELRQGRRFSAVARRYSEGPAAPYGGDLGYVRKGDLKEEIRRYLSSLRPGQLSGLIQTPEGVHIIKLVERKGSPPLPFEEVKERVREIFIEEALAKEYQKWLAEARKRYSIEVKRWESP